MCLEIVYRMVVDNCFLLAHNTVVFTIKQIMEFVTNFLVITYRTKSIISGCIKPSALFDRQINIIQTKFEKLYC